MTNQKRIKLQVDTTENIRDLIKAAAYSKGMQLNEFVLSAVAKSGNAELAKLITKDLAEKTKPGRPQK